MTLVDLALTLRHTSKLLLAIDNPYDSQIVGSLINLINKAKHQQFDDEIRGMIASTFKGIAEVYYKSPKTLLAIYAELSSFIKTEIENGKP